MKKKIFAVLLITAAVISLTAGVLDGQVNTVFIKSINICMECIGLG